MQKGRFFHTSGNMQLLVMVNYFDNLQSMSSGILSIGTALPPYPAKQSELVHFMAKYLDLDRTNARRLQVLYNLSGIDTRYSVIPDFTNSSEDFELFAPDGGRPYPSTEDRMRIYQKYAANLGTEAAHVCLRKHSTPTKDVTHLIVVSCTGMYAPGLDIDLVKSLQLPTSVERTAINFMGCYAAFNALKAADKIARADPGSVVLIVAVETCTLHFQKSTNEDAMVSNALFADGAAAVLIGSSQKKGVSLSMDGFHSDLFLDGQEDMGWYIRDFGFEMKLTAEVPSHIQDGIAALTDRLLGKIDVPLESISHFAIHPGGRKILDVIEEELGLSTQQNEPARFVMKNFGNMSSPSVLFAIEHIMQRLTPENKDERILSFAFGPGLTMESMLLTVQHDA